MSSISLPRCATSTGALIGNLGKDDFTVAEDGKAQTIKHFERRASALLTGGRVFKVDRKNTLDNVFQQLQDEMRSQYAIGYTPLNGSATAGSAGSTFT